MYDLLFRDARVVDGTGRPGFYADVGVAGDRIVEVGHLAGVAQRTIAVDGRALAPGFIDLHTHADFTLPQFPRAEAMVRQGVTTVVVGNCGFSPFPVRADRLDLLRAHSAFLGGDMSWEWDGAAGYAAFLEKLPLACNVALQVGHGSVRIAVMGFEQRGPTPDELAAMERLVAQSFEEGAVGLSSGLIYAPGSYSRTSELVALARVAGLYGGFYASHIRGEGDTLLEAVGEALLVGRAANVPVQLSHHKAMGRRNWGRVSASLGLIDQARKTGEDVLADQYPYTAGSTTLAAILPPWALEGGFTGLRERLSETTGRARIRAVLAPEPTDIPRRGAAPEMELEAIVIGHVPDGPHKPYEGRRLVDIAGERGEPLVDTALYLLEREPGQVQIIVFGMDEADVRTVMRHPAVAIASDGWTLSPAAGGRPHPRSYGTYARVLGRYVREEKVLGLEEAVHKMTGLPAWRLRRDDLGTIQPGCAADLVVFDPEQVTDVATFEDPHRFCRGVCYVVVNGQVVVEEGHDTGATAGRVLRRGRRRESGAITL